MGLDGAEAILTLRAVISNGDFEEYWRFHLAREHQRLYTGTSQGTVHTRHLTNYLTPEELHPSLIGPGSSRCSVLDGHRKMVPVMP
jgi:hypothetical protein